MNAKCFLAACALLAAPIGATAQSMKPGLWEVNNKIQMGAQMDKEMAQMREQMAAMPPDQRKMTEEMMARQGMRMGAGGAPGNVSVRVCMTREMAERNEVAGGQGDCRNSVSPRTGNSMKFSFSCTNPPSSGEGQVSFLGADSYTTKMTLNTVVQGKTEKASVEGSGRWLSADCGAVKPAAGK